MDRRTEPRFGKVFSVYISGAWGSSLGIARNISEGGLFIETPDPYPLGSRMTVTFANPDGETEMTALGEVTHICFLNRTPAGAMRKVMTGMGIRFLHFIQEVEHTNEVEVYAQLQ